MEEPSTTEDLPIRAPGPAQLKKKLFLGRFPLTAPDFDPDQGAWHLHPDPEAVSDKKSSSSSSFPRTWVLDNPHGKPLQKGIMEGGLSNAATYFVLVRQEEEFIAIPVEHWFNFKPLRGDGDVSLEQVELDMKAADALMDNKLVPKSVVARKEQEKEDGVKPRRQVALYGAEGEGEGGRKRIKREKGSDGDDDEAPEDLYEGVEDELRPERPEQAEDWEHEHNVDDDDEEMGDELEERLEDDPGERKKLGLEEEEEEELDDAGRAIKKLVDRENKSGSDDDTPDKPDELDQEGGVNEDELDEMDEETMDLDEVFKDDEEAGGKGRNARAASPAPAGRGGDGGAPSRRRTPPPSAVRRATPPPTGNVGKRKADGAGEEQAKRARVEPKSGAGAAPRAPLPIKMEIKQEGGIAPVKTEPGTGKAPAASGASRGMPPVSGGVSGQRKPVPPPSGGQGAGLPTPEEIKQVVGSNRYSVKALISHFKGRIRKEDTGLFQKTVLSVAKLSKGADGVAYLELK